MRSSACVARLTRINLTLSSLIAGHRALLRARTQSELFDNICHVLVETGGYRFAWVSTNQSANGSETVISAAGFESSGLDENVQSISGNAGLTADRPGATRSGRTQAVQNPAFYDALHSAAKPRSSVGFPLYIDGKIFAYLNLLAENLDGFDHDVVVLLERLTHDLCYCLNTLIIRNGRDSDQPELADTIIQRAIILESIPDIAYQLDTESRLVIWNKRMVSVTQYSSDELLHKPAVEFFPEYHQQKVSQAIQQVYQNGYADVSADLLTKKGETIPYHINGTLVKNEDDQIVGITGVGRDLSEQYEIEREKTQLQKQLLQSQKMEAIGQLTGGIAHDFNNILASILGYTNLARIKSRPYNDTKLNEHLRQIQHSGTQARDIIKQMLAFSRDSEIDLVPVQLQPLILEFGNILNTSIPSTIKINYALNSETPRILANPVQLNQVVLNLCINARDAIADHGQIDIMLHQQTYAQITCASCKAPLHGNFVELSVHDNGNGIRTQHLDKIFDPFFSTKELGRGSGMGLAMAHRIIHKHQGHIRVDTEADIGTTFCLIFPALAEPDRAADKAHESIDRNTELRNKGRILIVDDDRSIVFFETELLQSQGFEVTAFTDSEQSLRAFERNPMQFDLLLTDQTMPKLNGLELARKVCSSRPDLPVILCSGQSLELDSNSLSTFGIDRYLQKPVDVDILLRTINEIIKT